MNILTDVLSLIRRRQFVKAAKLDDVIVLGINEEPDMTGIASPIPYKSIKLIKVKDFKIAAEHCDHANSPDIPSSGTAQVYQKTEIDPITEKCTVFFRSLKSMSTNLTLDISADDNYVEITTTGEPNTAANVGTGAEVFKDKVGETLNFRSIVQGTGITVTQSTNEITIVNSGIVSLTTVGTSGTAATLISGVLDIPTPVIPFTSLTTTGISGVSTLLNGVLNIPDYAIGEINLAANVGTGMGLYRDKIGETLNFKTLTSSDSSVTITQSADEVDLSVVSGSGTIVEDTIGSGAAYMKYISAEPGGIAMVYPNFKVSGSENIAGIPVYSPHLLDWTSSDAIIDINDPAENFFFINESYMAIPIGKTLASDDKITLNTLITIENTNGTTNPVSIFTLVGWYNCTDITSDKWPLNNQTILTDLSPSVSNGRLHSCGENSLLVTGGTSSNAYVGFGVSFDGIEPDAMVTVSWSITTTKN